MLSNLVSFHSVGLAGHSDTNIQVTLVWQNDMWQMILRKEHPPTFFNIFQLCFAISLIALNSSCV